MLIVTFLNDKTGPDHAANYKVEVLVNNRRIATDRIEGHNRKDNWQTLVAKLVAKHSRAMPKEAPVCSRCGRPRSVGSADKCRRCYKAEAKNKALE